jgi:hypothetical protein
MTDPSFYYSIFRKLQATGASNGAHINDDNTPANQFYGGAPQKALAAPQKALN